MMYMPDAIRGTIELMEAPAEKIKVRSSYNISAIDFTPKEQAASIQKYIPDFKIDYAPDFRQKIAESWPESIDDAVAKNDWGWKPEFDLDGMTKDMLDNIGTTAAIVWFFVSLFLPTSLASRIKKNPAMKSFFHIHICA